MIVAVLHVAFVAAPYALSDAWALWREGAKGVYPPSLFNTYIGMTPYSVFTVILFYLVPALACIPYGESSCVAVETGYASQMVVRSGRVRYFASKALAAALAGGCVVVAPMAANFLLAACFVPALAPEPAAMTFQVPPFSMLADFFYAHPYAYVFLFFALAFLLACWAGVTSTALGFFVRNRFAVVLAPLALCVVLQFLFQGTPLAGISPLDAILPFQPYNMSFSVVLVVAAVSFSAVVVAVVVKSRAYEGI